MVLDRDERLLEVAQEPRHVADDEDVEGADVAEPIIASQVAVR